MTQRENRLTVTLEEDSVGLLKRLQGHHETVVSVRLDTATRRTLEALR